MHFRPLNPKREIEESKKIWDRTLSGQAFMTLRLQAKLSLKTFIEANLNRVESGQLFIWLYVSLVESLLR